MGYFVTERGESNPGRILFACVFALLILAFGGLYGCPQYWVWEQGLAGEAELKRASQNRQIVVMEAQAKEEAAMLLAGAEIKRAHGVAEANKIIGASLKDNDSYLRYLWISSLDNGAAPTVIYIPTEGGLPILEAGKR